MRTTSVAAALAVVGLAGMCLAGPTTNPKNVRTKAAPRAAQPALPPVGGMGPDDPGFTENFDGYAAGSSLVGQGPWIAWNVPIGAYPFPPTAGISNAQAASGLNSMHLWDANTAGVPATNETDAVKVFSPMPQGGKWIASIKTYVSSSATGQAYFILNDNYDPNLAGTDQAHWSVQVELDANLNTVASQWLASNLAINTPLIRNQWVEIRCDIDFDVVPDGLLVIKYGTNTITTTATPNPYRGNTSTALGGNLRIQAVDLYRASNAANPTPLNTGVFFDDFKVSKACYPDCNASGTLTVADFGCFQGKYVLGDMYADCNASGTLSVADFGCFQGSYVLGCP
ncbi:MAG: hypothetical protein ACKVU4_10435 [Phycisphaerales bacterium]